MGMIILLTTLITNEFSVQKVQNIQLSNPKKAAQFKFYIIFSSFIIKF